MTTDARPMSSKGYEIYEVLQTPTQNWQVLGSNKVRVYINRTTKCQGII